MKSLMTGILVFVGLILSGCSMKYPMNADEFRQMLPGSMFGEVEKFEVNQPIGKIAKTFKQKADTCLSKTLQMQSCVRSGYGGTSCSTTVIHYKPTVRVSPQRVELHLQQSSENFVTLGEIPKDGIYSLVADVTPVAKNKSQVVIYSGSFGSDTIKKAIHVWSSGKGRGCPDLTQG